MEEKRGFLRENHINGEPKTAEDLRKEEDSAYILFTIFLMILMFSFLAWIVSPLWR